MQVGVCNSSALALPAQKWHEKVESVLVPYIVICVIHPYWGVTFKLERRVRYSYSYTISILLWALVLRGGHQYDLTLSRFY